MRPYLKSFCVVTATTNHERSRECIASWKDRAAYRWDEFTIVNGLPASREYATTPHLGVVPAFAKGLGLALTTGAQVICCLHDDVLIEQDGWDHKVIEHFDAHPQCGLAGFGGGVSLGAADIYQRQCKRCSGAGQIHDPEAGEPDVCCPACGGDGISHDPMQLARGDFISNMRDAEAHGRRATEACRVSCLDGFSQIGRRSYWQGWKYCGRSVAFSGFLRADEKQENLFQRIADLGIVHHAYDAALGCYAARLGWEAWMLPIACHHKGGETAVADQDYHAWARTQNALGDIGFWEDAHKIVFDEFRDVLPLGVG